MLLIVNIYKNSDPLKKYFLMQMKNRFLNTDANDRQTYVCLGGGCAMQHQ